MGDLKVKQQAHLTSFKKAVEGFIAVRDGQYLRRSKNYWSNYNAVVDTARTALKSMGALGRRPRVELDGLRRDERPV